MARARRSEIRQVYAADSLYEEGTIVEAIVFLVGKGEDKAAEKKEENDGLVAGDEEPEGGAIKKVDDCGEQMREK